jgi:hypothetical protein
MDTERLPQDQADALARLAGGLAGTAIRYARDRDLIGWRRRTQLQLTELLERGRADRFAAVKDLIDEAVALGAPADAADDDDVRTPAATQRLAALRVVEVWIGLARDLLLAGAGRAHLTPSGELADHLESLGRRIGTAPLVTVLDHLERAHAGLRENAAPRLTLEAAMLRWPMLPRTAER